jgi:hypothetical protein
MHGPFGRLPALSSLNPASAPMIAHCLGENAPSPVAGAKKQDFKISASVMFARLA